ncbi:Uncharacterized protein FWK35_00007575 [Aphis craccivora]|uniref:Uncharacterized protein n=1 Tax=Aphis craccivora TaxID=307492 RepID=A0A6G0YT09_APHCR|nr:Uncharacterized protein FWK35_00007575 [Aphis craccivora]
MNSIRNACITCSEKTGTNVGATKPNKSLYIHKSEYLPDEEVTTEDNSAKQSMTNRIRSIITKPVDLITNIWPVRRVLSSLKTAVNIFNPQTTANDKPLKN